MALNENRISKPFKKLRKSLRKISQNAAPDVVHELRTGARRIEAIAHAMRLDSDGTSGDLLKPLSRLRKKAGKVRDMDVLTGHTSHVELKGEEECIIQLLEHLGAERLRHARKLRSLIAKDGSKLRRRLNSARKDIGARLSTEVDDASRAGVEAEVMEIARELTEDLRKPAAVHHGNLHAYRLKVKEARYVLQMAEGGSQEFQGSLGQVKDSIGEWHDWLELAASAKDVLPHGRNCALLRHLQETVDYKYKEALLTTNRMRKKFLAAKTQGGRRATTANANQVLATTSTIAA